MVHYESREYFWSPVQHLVIIVPRQYNWKTFSAGGLSWMYLSVMKDSTLRGPGIVFGVNMAYSWLSLVSMARTPE